MHVTELIFTQLQNSQVAEDPKCRKQLVAYVQASSEPFTVLQSDFHCISSRIGQVRYCTTLSDNES